eukprot:scaffold27017_cov61-Phaeocystis_antarctica.AAC.2
MFAVQSAGPLQYKLFVLFARSSRGVAACANACLRQPACLRDALQLRVLTTPRTCDPAPPCDPVRLCTYAFSAPQ